MHLPTEYHEDSADTQAQGPPRAVTWRAVLLGLLLLLPNVGFILLGYIRHQSRPTTVSLIFTAIITLFVVVALNALVRRLKPRWALRFGELITIYVMLSVGSALVGLDQLQTMLPVVAYPHWYATPENDWQSLFLEEMPSWLTVTDPDALWAYYDSRGPLLTTSYWRPWVRPALLWAGFSLILFFVMLILGGAGPPPEVLPDVMRTIGEVLPTHWVIYAIQDPWFGLGWNLQASLIVAGIFVGAAALSVRFFRWE